MTSPPRDEGATPLRHVAVILLAFMVVASTLYLRWRPAPTAEINERESEVVLPPELPPSRLPVLAPEASEVQPTLDRVFDQTVTVDRATKPAFVAGDFNGDDAVDLAVAVRPRFKSALLELNADFPAWSLQDAAAPADGVRPEPVKVAPGDLLLAVVHGVADGGWRHSDALQCYLVKNAVGSGLRTRPLAGVSDDIRMRIIRSHTGDVMETNRGGKPGLIIFTGATYAWADLNPLAPVRSPRP